MVIDTSALLAILFGESEASIFAKLIGDSGIRIASSVTAFEAGVVMLSRKGAAGVRDLDLLFHTAAIEIVPFNEEHLLLARESYERYGKGRHPAALNIGDCCAYALARHSGEPLLFKGDDFVRTDVVPAVIE